MFDCGMHMGYQDARRCGLTAHSRTACLNTVCPQACSCYLCCLSVLESCALHTLYMPHTHTHICRFPDFSVLSPTHDFTSVIDAVFISHFHMDHVGALPYFTEVCVREGGGWRCVWQRQYRTHMALPGCSGLSQWHTHTHTHTECLCVGCVTHPACSNSRCCPRLGCTSTALQRLRSKASRVCVCVLILVCCLLLYVGGGFVYLC